MGIQILNSIPNTYPKSYYLLQYVLSIISGFSLIVNIHCLCVRFCSVRFEFFD